MTPSCVAQLVMLDWKRRIFDLYARVRVVLPTDLDEKATAAAKRFLDLVDQPDPRT